jgi:hyperosmotically inducible periplasmic protein
MNISTRVSCIAAVAALAALCDCAIAQPATPSNVQPDVQPGAQANAASNAKAARAANRELAHRVENALARTRGLNSARIIVTARDGRITLSGAVNYTEQIALAVEAARQVEGVTDVENRIRVTGASL